jgi:hypothetical protein
MRNRRFTSECRHEPKSAPLSGTNGVLCQHLSQAGTFL